MTNSGVLSNKKGVREAKEAAGAMQYGAASGMEAAAAYRAQLMAAEMGRMQVAGMLGAPGTYGAAAGTGQPGSATGVMDTSGLGLSQPDQGLAQGLNYSTGGKGLLGTARTGILDPEAYAASIANSSSFRTRSALTAEAEQLANREGELYDRLENSIIGVINQGAAEQLRQALRLERNHRAKGGGARSAATANLREIKMHEDAMTQRITQTWQATMSFQKHMWAQIDNVQKGNTDFLENLPLTNRAFLDASGESAKMQMDAGAMAAKIAMSSFAVKQSQQPVNFGVGFAESLIGMVTSWGVGELGKMGADPRGYIAEKAEGLRAGTEYAKGLVGGDVKDAEGNPTGATYQDPLQGPSTPSGMGPIDTYNEGAMGSAWSSILGWAGGNK
jgi:hypothetical protein